MVLLYRNFPNLSMSHLAGKVVSQVNEGGKIFDLTIKVADHDRDSMEEIGELMLDADGRKVPLHYVAEVSSPIRAQHHQPGECTT